ncbi:MAG: MoaD/ThiS family protein [Gemmatimonadota bacterium]|nr:MoaD/ThiS family protein [Gemmatimonadota bacterium]HEU4988488.1 MoaD/ThiS family protein [Gemmatimonadaceae bacterium]
MIRVVLPAPLYRMAGIEGAGELAFDVAAPVTQRTVLDAVEARYPMLRGAIRDHDTKKRRPFIRFYACEDDLSFAELDDPLPAEVVDGREPYLVIGAIAGG